MYKAQRNRNEIMCMIQLVENDCCVIFILIFMKCASPFLHLSLREKNKIGCKDDSCFVFALHMFFFSLFFSLLKSLLHYISPISGTFPNILNNEWWNLKIFKFSHDRSGHLGYSRIKKCFGKKSGIRTMTAIFIMILRTFFTYSVFTTENLYP